MTLRQKLLLAQAPLLLALAVLSGLALHTISSLGVSSQTILQENYRSVLAAQRMKEAIERMDSVSGEIFNIGGGPENTISLLELLEWLQRHCDRPVLCSFSDWRPGDQAVYISNIAKASQKLGWAPSVTVAQGLERLWEWVESHRDML